MSEDVLHVFKSTSDRIDYIMSGAFWKTPTYQLSNELEFGYDSSTNIAGVIR